MLPDRDDSVSTTFPQEAASETGATRIQLCGRLKVDFEGRHVTPALRGRQGRVLLAFLVLNRGRSVSRDELIEAIWPESSPADPPAALRTQLSRLRSALGAEALAGRDTVELRLPPNTWIDVEAAERSIQVANAALKDEDWRDAWTNAHIALNIAGRPFLAGFEAPWVEDVRRELEELELRSRETIARAGIGLGGSELAGAERSARALIRSAPFRESGYLNLMRTLVASGNTAEALRTYDDLRRLLAEELGSAPGAEIQSLHRQLLGGMDGSSTSSPPPLDPTLGASEGASRLALPNWLRPHRGVPFLGRSAELGSLSRIWAETQGGELRIALIEGEPGVGKTRLLTEFARLAHDGGATVLYGRADEATALTHQPFAEALRHWAVNAPAAELESRLETNATTLASLIPELGVRLPREIKPEPKIAPDRLNEAVVETLAAIAAGRPLLLVLDDLHWADCDSLALLRQLARSAGASPIMILASYRPTTPNAALRKTLADLGRERLFERTLLSGLSASEVAKMVGSIRGRPETDLAEAICEETGGNPFLVEALLDNLGSRPFAPAGNRRGQMIYENGIPDLVRESVAHRVAELGPPAAELLEFAAAIGPEFDAELLLEFAEAPAQESLACLDASVAAGLLAPVPQVSGRYTFTHAIYRQALYAAISERRRLELHGVLATALESRHGISPRHVAELARHYSESGPANAAKAVEYSVRAGAGALASLAFEDAAEHYARALRSLEASGETEERLRCEILIALGEAEWRTGDVDASRETLRRAARMAERTGDGDALARAVLGFCGFGWEQRGDGDPDALALLQTALSKEELPASLRARLLARLATILPSAGPGGDTDRISLKALESAQAAGENGALAAALVGRWHAASGPGGAAARGELAVRLTELAESLRDRDLELQALSMRVLASLELGRFADLDLAIAEHAQLVDRLKLPAGQIRSRAYQAMRALLDGRLESAEHAIGDLVEMGAQAQSPSAIELSVIELLALNIERGRLGDLEQPVRNLSETAGTSAAWKVALTFVLAEAGSAEDAEAMLATIAEEDFSLVPRDANELGSLATLALVAVRLGDRDRAEQLADRLTPFRGQVVVLGGGAVFAGAASHYLGILATALGREEQAVELLEEALTLCQRAGALPWLARSRHELSRALEQRAGPGDAARAAQELAQSCRIAERLGLAGLLEQVGESVGRRGAPTRI